MHDPRWVIGSSLQLTASSCSFIASTALVVVILRTTFLYKASSTTSSGTSTNRSRATDQPRRARTLQNSAYKRIIFCISLSDMLQSFGSLVGPFAVVTNHSHWSLGSQPFCTFAGLILGVGATGVLLYSPLLAFYYFCKLHRNMSEDEIFHKVEMKAHFFIFGLIAIVNAYALVTKAINSATSGTLCTYAATPTNCRFMDDTECDANMMPALLLNVVIAIIIPFASLVVIISILSFLVCKILWRERVLPPSNHANNLVGTRSNDNNNIRSSNLEPQILRNGTSRHQLPPNSYRREMIFQLISYSLAFFVSYILYAIVVLQIFSNRKPHMIQYYWVQFCVPLQGLFNILIFNRPDARVLKYKYPNLSWGMAFWLVFKHGGDSNLIISESSNVDNFTSDRGPKSNVRNVRLDDGNRSQGECESNSEEISDIAESHCVHISSHERVSFNLEEGNRISNCFHLSGDGFEEDKHTKCNVYDGVKVPKF